MARQMVTRQMKILLPCVLLLLGTFAPSVCVSGPIFEERGTLMVGAHFQHGLLAGEATPVDNFDRGNGYGLRLRYYLGGNRALGVSLENQRFDGIEAQPGPDQPQELTIALMTVDYLWYFDRKSAFTRYATVGLGVHHPGSEYKSGTEVGPDGFVLCVGGGFEHFFHRLTAVDFSARGYGLFGQDGLMGSVQFAIGLNFYITD